jgi:broad specificity phosphatase PhoE
MAKRSMSAAVIYFVHHGETEWNRAGRFQGRHDSPLTPEGRRQARRVAALLAGELPAPRDVALVTSPLGRAVTTAGILADVLDLPIFRDERLAELSLGEWEGLTRAEIEARRGQPLAGASRWDWYLRVPGGEDVDGVLARLRSWLAEQRRPTIAVGHGVAGRLLRGLYAGLDREAALTQPVVRDAVFKLANGAITFMPGPAEVEGS